MTQDWRLMWAGEYAATRSLILSAWETIRRQAVAEDDIPSDEETDDGWLPPRYMFQPNRTLQLYADLVREHRGDPSRPCNTTPPAPRAPEGRIENLLTGFGPNGAGRILVWIAIPQFERMGWRRCLSDTRLAAAQVSLALRAHQLEHGSLPETLDALVPAFFESVPRDAFDGAALRYRPGERLLYSIGADYEDAGGAEGEDPLLEPRFPLAF